jgi:hypothetical protein
MHNRPWTPKEKNLANRLRKEGKTYKEIGEIIGRTEAAVSQYFNCQLQFEENLLFYRTRLNFIIGAIYEIKPVGRYSGSVDFLPSKFEFIGECKGARYMIYKFRSVNGGYMITFTTPQAIGYTFHRIEEPDNNTE